MTDGISDDAGRGRARLLLVDDEKEMCELLTSYFRALGFEATAVQTGEEATGLIEAAAFDLVILDLNLKGWDGLDLLNYSKRLHPDIPIIIFTGVDDDELFLKRALARRADGFVRKTAPLNVLLGAVLQHVGPGAGQQ